jgi:hypothetical protein
MHEAPGRSLPEVCRSVSSLRRGVQEDGCPLSARRYRFGSNINPLAALCRVRLLCAASMQEIQVKSTIFKMCTLALAAMPMASYADRPGQGLTGRFEIEFLQMTIIISLLCA